jgi:HEAT repeat protein
MEYVRIETVIQRLSDPDPSIRMGAADWLGDFNDLRAVPPLIKALDDEYFDVRAYAAHSLGLLKDPQSVKPLRTLHDDDNEDVKTFCIGALGEIADSRATNILENIVDSNATLRPETIIALAKIGSNTIRMKVLGFLQDDQQTERVYYSSIMVVGELKIESGVELIEPFLKRDDLDLVNITLQALTQVGTQAARDAIENNLVHLDHYDREMAGRFLKRFGNESTQIT